MRILVHSIFYRPELTGVAKYTAEMCEWLVARGHEAEVVCPPPYYPQWSVAAPYRQWRYQRETLNGVRITRCPLWLPRTPGGLKRILYSISFMLSSWFAIAVRAFRRPDVVFVLEPSFLNVIPCLLLARVTGATSWLHIQDFEIDIAFDLGQLRQPWLRSTLQRFESWMMRRFDVVSTISQPMAAKARAKGVTGSQFVFFPDWVDTNVIFPMNCPGSLRSELGIASDQVVALFSGTLGTKQGIETIIAAAKRLHESTDSQIAFVICGEGPAASRLRSQAAELPNVRFIPLQPASRLNDLLNSADIHLLPQVPEVADSVLPSKVLGMLASGRPIIATVGAQSEIARLVGKSGLFVAPGDSSALCDAIRELAADAGRRSRMGAEARRIAVGSLHSEVILRDFETELTARVARGFRLRAPARIPTT
jgi:putative colanic acid biosynthesis glycosyltransferase WcaI